MRNKQIKIILKDKGNLLANVTITISSYDFGYITIKYFQIWRSRIFNNRLKENINIQPPGKMIFGRYHPFVFFEDIRHWYELEQEIYMTYLEKKNENEEINVESINI